MDSNNEKEKEEEVTHQNILDKIDSLELKLEPVFEAWADVAAVGRVGRLATRITIRLGAVTAALAAIYVAIKEWPNH